MATYAAVVSLINTMDAVMNDPRLSSCFDKKQIQSLGENLDILLQFIENYNYNSLGSDEGAQSLERRITSAAHAAEDVIESHIVAQIHAGVLENTPTSSIDLHQIMPDIEEIKEEVVKVVEKMGSNDQKPKDSPQPQRQTGKITMIGFDDYLNQLLDGLTGSESGRQVIPIVGMGGVGKTTLTKNAYEHSLTVQRFDVCAWVSISLSYDVKKILEQLLSTLGQSTYGDEGELIERLYKYLFGRRYLVVLDDMWSVTAWDKIKSCFPKGSNSSRIIVTTRLLEVANSFGSLRMVRVGLLDDDKSWDLFCDKAFGQHGCPDELEQIGKEIVKKCKGLPLLIVVIGALLGKSDQTKQYWENFAGNMNSIMSSAKDSECLDILCMSYNHLPAHLRPCFLYLGVYDEDKEIYVSELIKIWIAEGFIKPTKDQMLEEVAEGYVKDMLERSLILVDSFGWNTEFERFRVHDLVRDLCLREAKKEKFYSFISGFDGEQEVDDVGRCILYHEESKKKLSENKCYVKTPFARTLICKELKSQLYWSKLMRVCVGLHTTRLLFDNIVEYFRELVNMRFMFCKTMGMEESGTYQLPRSIFQLWNMQTFNVQNFTTKVEAPIEIWMMRQLRHVEFLDITLPEPPMSDEEDEFVILHNLQTLLYVKDLSFSEEVCKRIPNVKRLGVEYTDFSKNSNDYCLHNVGRLNKLESLSCHFGEEPHRGHLLQNLMIPTSLKELSLWNSNLDWDDLGIIGSLPNLEVLKLHHKKLATDCEWKCVEGEFLALKYLEIRCRELRTWNAESSHFPVLHTLVLEDLRLLDGIPSGIGDIPTLRNVLLCSCDTTTVISAMKMLEEQESLENDDIQLQLVFSGDDEVKNFLEEVKEEKITCTNFKYRI